MNKLIYLAVLVLAVGAINGENGTETDVDPTLSPPNSSTKPPPPPTTTPTTTTSTTTPTTTTPTTTTTKPTTTTTKPTTTTSPTTSTSKPTTTTSVPTPKPTAPPAPKPDIPHSGFWVVNTTKDSNVSCVLTKMAMQFVIPYNTTENKTVEGFTDLSENATATGNCSKLVQNIILTWDNNTVTLNFAKENENSTNFYLASISANIIAEGKNYPNAPKDTRFNLIYAKALFNTSVKASYKCDKKQTFNLTAPGATNDTLGSLTVSKVQFEAFHNATGKDFSSAADCDAIDTADVVPIAVGCCLAALIIIVLVAYLVGRRRSQARGYLSMFSQTKKEEDYIPMKNLSCFGN